MLDGMCLNITCRTSFCEKGRVEDNALYLMLFILVLKFVIFIIFLGITNGIDVSEWDPSADEHIAAHYSVDDLSGKVVKFLIFFYNQLF